MEVVIPYPYRFIIPGGFLLAVLVVAPVSAQERGFWARSPETAGSASPIAPPVAGPVDLEVLQARRVPIPQIPDRWKIAAEFSLTDQSGNRVLRLLTGGLRISHREKEAFELDGAVRSRYGKNEREIVARSHFASLAFDLTPRDTWSPFLYFTAEHDPFKRLNLRFSGGAGAKYTPFVVQKANEVSTSLALLYSVEDLRPSTADPDPLDRSIARWSFRLQAAQVLTETLRLQHVSSYEPVWDDMADYLLRAETGARVVLTERLALSVTYALDRTARPPEGVEPNDRLLKTGLIIDF